MIRITCGPGVGVGAGIGAGIGMDETVAGFAFTCDVRGDVRAGGGCGGIGNATLAVSVAGGLRGCGFSAATSWSCVS